MPLYLFQMMDPRFLKKKSKQVRTGTKLRPWKQKKAYNPLLNFNFDFQQSFTHQYENQNEYGELGGNAFSSGQFQYPGPVNSANGYVYEVEQNDEDGYRFSNGQLSQQEEISFGPAVRNYSYPCSKKSTEQHFEEQYPQQQEQQPDWMNRPPRKVSAERDAIFQKVIQMTPQDLQKCQLHPDKYYDSTKSCTTQEDDFLMKTVNNSVDPDSIIFNKIAEQLGRQTPHFWKERYEYLLNIEYKVFNEKQKSLFKYLVGKHGRKWKLIEQIMKNHPQVQNYKNHLQLRQYFNQSIMKRMSWDRDMDIKFIQLLRQYGLNMKYISWQMKIEVKKLRSRYLILKNYARNLYK